MEEIVRLVRPDIYAMTPYSSARTEGPQDASIYLDANENPYPPYPGGREQDGLNRYPEPQPQALIDRFSELFALPKEQLFLSRGADEAIDLLVRAFCEAGVDGVIITPPAFPMYEVSAQIQGAAVHRVPLLEKQGFALDVEGVLAMQDANPTAKLVFVCSPNNPTGNSLDRRDLLRLADALLGKALVVVDHTYVEYSGESSLAGEIGTHANLVVLRTLTKEYSLAGERCGITAAHQEVIRILRRVMAPYSMPVSVVRTVLNAMTPEGVAYAHANIRRLLGERDRVREVLERSAAVTHIVPSDANFLLVQTLDAHRLVQMMQTAGIKIRDRSSVIEGAVRISIGTPDENDQMLKVFADYESSCAV